jgi:sugar lactone lactonase YvrE
MLSLPFVFHDKQIEFAAGLAWHPDGKRLLVSYGVKDQEAWVCASTPRKLRTCW